MVNEINNKNNLRCPIITVAGHIDHGKTTLINYIGKIFTPKKEHINITQHIKAYNFKTNYGNMTFLDTPGHFAFNILRENTIKYSDIVLLVIAADDGIKPQTIESIIIAKKYSVPVIVVVNKIDKFEKIKFDNTSIINDLSKYGLILENWGGDTILTYVSSKTGEGINELLELIKLQSDILNLKVENEKPYYGIVLDNKIDIGFGGITTLILKSGNFKTGDSLRIKFNVGKIKSIFDLNGNNLDYVFPSIPVNVVGLPNSIEIGELFFVNDDLNINNKNFKNFDSSVNNYNLDYLIKNFSKASESKLNLIVKADSQGSLNVLKESLNNLSTNNVKVNLVKIDLGSFNESDIELALVTKAILIGFNIKINSKIKKFSVSKTIKLNIFNVIYDLIDFVNLEIKNKENLNNIGDIVGIAEVKKVFKQDNINIAGCLVIYGKIKNKSNIKIFRKNNLIYEGHIDCIKVFKNVVNEVKLDEECGITVKNYSDFQINDKINFY